MTTRTATVAPPRALRILAAVTASALLAACGGGGHGSGTQSTLPSVPGGPVNAPVGSAPATFTFTFPKPNGPQDRARLSGRAPKYLSSATASITVQVSKVMNGTTDITANVPPALKAVQSVTFANLTGNSSTPGQCGSDPNNPGNFKCTAVFQMPIGTDTTTIASWDAAGGTGNKLSQNVADITILQGVTNKPSVSLDANVGSLVLSGTAACASGPVGASFGSVGTSAVTFNAAYKDLAGKTIVDPGKPTLQVQDSGATFQSSGGTINGTGGRVTFSINQSAQTITLTPSTVPITNVPVNVRTVAKNSTDGLPSFPAAASQSFTFSTGTAPPASFLALIEQTGTSTGEVDLFTVDLTLNQFHTSAVSGGGNVLPVTNSTNEGKPDIDNPRDIMFDTNENLLIANGGQGGAIVAGSQDFGDFACIPAGAIATGSTTTTTSSGDALDPESVAFNAGDSSVSIANVPASASFNTVRYLLGGTYVEGSSTQNIANPGGTVGAFSVISMPSLPAGTFAAAITNGTTISKIALKGPSGTETPITDTDISTPKALGWDAASSQLAIANHQIVTTGTVNDNKSKLVFFTVSGSPTKVKSVQLGTDPTTSTDSYMFGDKVAVSADGHVAVGGGTADGPAEVRVFDNTAARAPVGGAIPFDSYTNSGCTVGNFGNVTVVHAMRWLNNTKLLIVLQANGTGKQGAYIYDISQLVTTPGLWEFDGNAGHCNAVTATSPKQVGFQSTSNVPLSAAYKP